MRLAVCLSLVLILTVGCGGPIVVDDGVDEAFQTNPDAQRLERLIARRQIEQAHGPIATITRREAIAKVRALVRAGMSVERAITVLLEAER